MKGLRRLRRNDLLLLLLKGPLLAGDLLLPECEDMVESSERRLLPALVLRKIPLRLRFFSNGGLGGLPGDTPSGRGEGDGESARDVACIGLCGKLSSGVVLRGVCGAEHRSAACAGDFGEGDSWVSLMRGFTTGRIQDPIDSREDKESWRRCSSFMLSCSVDMIRDEGLR